MVKRSYLFGVLAAMFYSGATAAGGTMWLINEDGGTQGKLFRVTDYDNSAGKALGTFAAENVTDFGTIKVEDPMNAGMFIDVGIEVEAFALNRHSGDAFFSVNQPNPIVMGAPKVFHFNINSIIPGDVRAERIVSFDPVWNDSGDVVSSLAIDPTSGDLIALFRQDDPGPLGEFTVDELYRINDPLGSATLTSIGTLQDTGVIAPNLNNENPADYQTLVGLNINSVAAFAEEIEFREDGKLYISDDRGTSASASEADIALARDPLILADFDPDGTPFNPVDPIEESTVVPNSMTLVTQFELHPEIALEPKMEGLAWDPFSDRLLGFDDNNDEFYILIAGGTVAVSEIAALNSLGLTDVEGFAVVPVPTALPLFLSGIAGLGFAARRRRA